MIAKLRWVYLVTRNEKQCWGAIPTYQVAITRKSIFGTVHWYLWKYTPGHIICYLITCWLVTGGASFRGRRDSLGFRSERRLSLEKWEIVGEPSKVKSDLGKHSKYKSDNNGNSKMDDQGKMKDPRLGGLNLMRHVW
jgi:hypothetical protein